MSLSILDLAQARDAVSALLDTLRLDAYLFAVEPHDEYWELSVECACEKDGSWETIVMRLSRQSLQESLADSTARQALLDNLAKALALCK